jgi:hypothetical protein
MVLASRPINCFSLRFEGGKHVVGVIFNYVIVDMAALGAALGTRLNVNVGHDLAPGDLVDEVNRQWRPRRRLS